MSIFLNLVTMRIRVQNKDYSRTRDQNTLKAVRGRFYFKQIEVKKILFLIYDNVCKLR